MSYTVVHPGARPRPTAVTVAGWLLYAIAAIQVVSIALSAMSLGPVTDVMNEEFTGQPGAEAVRTVSTAVIIVAMVVAVIYAVGSAVLGLLIHKGKNPARIVTWVLAGIGVLCYGCSLGGTAMSGTLNGAQNDAQAEAMQRRIEEAVPAWQTAISTTLTVGMLLILLAVIILLALPASNDFFRKEQEVWVPPTWPGGAAPATPAGFPPADGGYPPAPGAGGPVGDAGIPPLPPGPPPPPGTPPPAQQ